MKRFNRIVLDTSTLVSAALRVGSIHHKADVLVSSDADLLVLHPWQRVLVITPANFLLTTHTEAL